MFWIGLAKLRLHEDVAVLGSAAGAGDVKLGEAVEVAGRAPSGVALIVSVVRSGLRHAVGKCGADEDVAALVCAEHGINLGCCLRVREDRCGQENGEECAAQNSVHSDDDLYIASASEFVSKAAEVRFGLFEMREQALFSLKLA